MQGRDEHSDVVGIDMEAVDTIIYEKRAPQLARQKSTIFFTKDKDIIEKYIVSDLPSKKGKYGEVRFFTSEQGMQLAVKSPRGVFRNPKDFDGVDIIQSTAYFKKAYPEFITTLHVWRDTFRQVMPKLPGVSLYEKLNDCSEAEYIDMLLATATELCRLHALNIVHGDLHPGNILIDDSKDIMQAYIIDFDYAYDLDGLATVINGGCPYWAPERTQNVVLKAHASQDVFSFAVLPCYYSKVLTEELNAFLTKFQLAVIENKGEARPSLAFFINELQDIKLRVTHAIKFQP